MKTAFKLTTAASLAAAVTMAMAAPAFAWDAPAGGATITSAGTASFGVVDPTPGSTTNNADPNQGVKIVKRGETQPIADLRVVIPGKFNAGDKLFFDLSAGSSAGAVLDQAATNAAIKVQLAGTPTVSVDGVYADTLAVQATSITANGTEYTPLPAKSAGTAPSVSAAIVDTGLGVAKSNRLAITMNTAGALASGKWVLTIKGLSASLGTHTSIEDRLWMVASAGTNTGQSVTAGNDPFLAAAGSRTAIVAAVDATGRPTVEVENKNLISDTSQQNLGKITVSETAAGQFAESANPGDNITMQFNGAVVVPFGAPKCTAYADNTVVPTLTCTATIDSANNKVVIDPTGAAPIAGRTAKLKYVVEGVGAKSSAVGLNQTFSMVFSGGSTGLPSASATYGPGIWTQSDLVNPLTGTAAATITGTLRANADRVGGADRYEVSNNIVTREFPGTTVPEAQACTNMVVAAGDDFALADSLSAGYLTQTLGTGVVGPCQQSAPLMITSKDKLSMWVKSQIARLGVKKVYIVGGAVSKAVEAEIAALPSYKATNIPSDLGAKIQTVRVDGATRFDVNRNANMIAVGRNAAGAGTTLAEYGKPVAKTAILAAGMTEKIGDALAATPMIDGEHGNSSAGGKLPLLITGSDKLGTQAESQIDAMNIKRVIIVGGTGSVSQSTEDALKAKGIVVTRLGGATRFDVAANIMKFALKQNASTSVTGDNVGLGWGFYNNASVLDGSAHSDDTAFLSSGFKFADALTGGANAMSDGSPNFVLLTNADTLPAATKDALTAVKKAVTEVVAVGGSASVSPAALTAARAAVAP